MVGLTDEEIMDVISRVDIEDPPTGHEGFKQWESRLQWKQRRDLVKAQLKKVAGWGNEPCPHTPTGKSMHFLRYSCPECWQSLLDEVEE